MSLRGLKHALLALAVAAPLRAAAMDVTGRLSLLYDRAEAWTPDWHDVSPRLTLEGGADGSGSLYRPGVVDWSGGAQYQRLRSSYFDQSNNDSTILTYRGTLNLFRNPRSPFSIGANANRSVSDSTYEGATSFAGTLLANSYGVDGYYDDRRSPVIRFGATAIDTTKRGFGTGESQTSSKGLRLGTTHGTAAFSYSADYRGFWNTGTFAADNYDEHNADVSLKFAMSPRLETFVQEHYLQRIATVSAQTNPALEMNALSAGVLWNDGDKTTARTQYSYSHSVATAPGSLAIERAVQSLSQTIQYAYSAEWLYSGNVALAFGQNRSGTDERQLTSQTVGGVARWQRTTSSRTYLLAAGPTIGLVQPAGGGSQSAYGGTAQGRIGWLWPASSAGIGYGITYANNTDAAVGSALSQNLTADAGAIVLGEARLRSLLTVAVDRRDLEPFGPAATRSILLTSDLYWARRTLSLQAGVSSGLAGSTPGAVSGDGLFLPARFNTHNRFASLSLALPLARPLSLVVRGNYVFITAPDRPDERQTGAYAALQYAIGAFLISVEDTYTVGGTTGFDRRENRFFVRATRVFGFRL